MELSTKDVPEAIVNILFAGLTPFLKGSPGIGKSDIIKQVAEELNLKVIDFRLSQADPTDLQGFPAVVEGRSTFMPAATFPIEGDTVPEGYDGWLVFLDEMNSGSLAVQAAAYKFCLDRQVGQHNLHKRVAVIGAGNLATDKAITNRMGTAMQSRLVHLTMNVDPNHWLNWANKSGIDHRITSFIEFRKDLLFKFNPSHSDDTFPCPRTWSFLSKMISGKEKLSHIDTVVAAGTIGEGPALEFKGFSEIFQNLPKVADIINKPDTVKIPNEPSVHYALAGLIAYEVTLENIDNLATFVERLPADFQVVAWKSAVRRNSDILEAPYIDKWITKNAQEML
jgi:hypothetical protein